MAQFFVLLAFTIIGLVVLFLPSLIELKKPKDNGPRKIVGFEIGIFFHVPKEAEPIAQTLSGAMPVVVFDSLTNLEV